MRAFYAGVSGNRSLQRFHVEEDKRSISTQGWKYCLPISNNELQPFVQLHLRDCRLGPRDINILASAFSQRRNPESINDIALVSDSINNTSVPAIVDICATTVQILRNLI